MTTELQRKIETTQLPAAEISRLTAEIYDTALKRSPYLKAGNFTSIHTFDLERLYDRYDEAFFAGLCRKSLNGSLLSFRLSKRMTRAAGTTQMRKGQGKSHREFEIAISTTLLFQSFNEDHRDIVVNGCLCRDRLESLQRVFEHELVHLLELMIWDRSSCSRPRFQSIANRLFGHTRHRHQLITPREVAATKFGILPGDSVSFKTDGKRYVGRVNRITKRATVLVEDKRGTRYTDGKHYAKFYVPLSMLEKVEP